MKYFIIGIAFLLSPFDNHAQIRALDSIDLLIHKAGSDTQRINLRIEKLTILANGKLDSAIVFADSIIDESKKINYKYGEARARIYKAGDYCFLGRYAEAKQNLDIAKEILSHTQDSATLIRLYAHTGMMYSMQNKFDTSHLFFNKAIEIARRRNDRSILVTALQNNAIAFQQESNLPQALTNYQEALSISEQLKDLEGEAYIDLNMAITYAILEDFKRSEESYLKAIDIAHKLNLKNVLAYGYANLAAMYLELKDYPKGFDAAIKAAQFGKEMGDQGIEATSLSRAATALGEQNKFGEAEKLNQQAIAIADSSRQPLNIFQTYRTMGEIFHRQKKYKQAIPYFEKAFHSIAESDLYVTEVSEAYEDLSDCYEKTGGFQKALATYKTAAKISDSIRGKENIKKSTELTLNYEFQKKQQKIQDEQERKSDLVKARQTALIIGLLLTLVLAIVAFNGFRNKRKANHLLQQQKTKVESTLSELKSTQSQLIHSEKMASLGELTAGIAHEIQNPLNFVINFSDVNRDWIAELKAEIKNGNTMAAHAIAGDIEINEEKINDHGKRADAIVKGMLYHSRLSTGQRELTDINVLADEYLKLAYLGWRAKDKEFNVIMKTDFDLSIPQIDIIPQEIGRVLLNLYNNAFYAVAEKAKQQPNGYESDISVSTRKIVDRISISIKDSGNGIPQKAIDKIFQPFFTTKPPGQGTGLGLSLSYDIILAHGGEIKVQTKEGEGAEFEIQIPFTRKHIT